MDERKKALLKEIVETYVKTIKPVGSNSLCKKLKCSSATIRNEMVALENMGYIEKNHISSGRVPSELGYKYYAEYLMEPKDLTGEDMLKLQTIFSNSELEVSDAVAKCLEIISDLTNYTSVVLGKNSYDNFLKQINIIALAEHKIIAVVCTDKGIVENKQFTLPDNTNVEEVIKVGEMVNKLLIGTPINKVAEKLELDIKPVIAKKVKDYETVYNIFYDAFNDFLLHNTNIGKDSNFDDNVTVIKKKYKSGGEEGTIAIIGPKRMQYERVVSLLNYMVDKIEGKDDGK